MGLLSNIKQDIENLIQEAEEKIRGIISDAVSDAESAVSDAESSIENGIVNAENDIDAFITSAENAFVSTIERDAKDVEKGIKVVNKKVKKIIKHNGGGGGGGSPPMGPSSYICGRKVSNTMIQKATQVLVSEGTGSITPCAIYAEVVKLEKETKKTEKGKSKKGGGLIGKIKSDIDGLKNIYLTLLNLPDAFVSAGETKAKDVIIGNIASFLAENLEGMGKGIAPTNDSVRVLFGEPDWDDRISHIFSTAILGIIAKVLPSGLGNEAFYMSNSMYPSRLPDNSELLNMEIRGAFNKPVRNFLTQEKSSELWKATMGDLGYDEFWAKSVWASHWNILQLGDIMDMFHRNRKGVVKDDVVFSEDDLKLWFDWSAILPEFQNKVTWAAYEPIPFFYVQGLVKDNILSTVEDAENAYLDIGMNPVLSKKLATAGLAMVDDKTKSLTLSAIIDLYKEHISTFTETYSDIQKLGYTKEAATKLMEIALAETSRRDTHELKRRVEKKSSNKKISESQAIDAFRYGVISKKEAEEYIVAFGFSGPEAEILLQTAEIKYKLRAPTKGSKS